MRYLILELDSDIGRPTGGIRDTDVITAEDGLWVEFNKSGVRARIKAFLSMTGSYEAQIASDIARARRAATDKES